MIIMSRVVKKTFEYVCIKDALRRGERNASPPTAFAFGGARSSLPRRHASARGDRAPFARVPRGERGGGPLATFRPPRGASDRASRLAASAFGGRSARVPRATTREAAAGGSPREEEANERDDVAPMASADALTDAGLSADVSAAVAFARSSLDAYENDRRYAAVVHEAVDALERRVLEESNSALSPERAARDATLRVALVELRDELDRALRYGPASNPRAYPRGVGTLPPETYYGAVAPARRRRVPPDAPSAGASSVPRAFSAFETTTLFPPRTTFSTTMPITTTTMPITTTTLTTWTTSIRHDRFVREDRATRATSGWSRVRSEHAHVRILQQTLREPRVDRRLDAVQHARAPLLDQRNAAQVHVRAEASWYRRAAVARERAAGLAVLRGGPGGGLRTAPTSSANRGCATRASRGAGRCSSARGRRSTPHRPRGTGNSVGFRGRAWCTGKHRGRERNRIA